MREKYPVQFVANGVYQEYKPGPSRWKVCWWNSAPLEK